MPNPLKKFSNSKSKHLSQGQKSLRKKCINCLIQRCLQNLFYNRYQQFPSKLTLADKNPEGLRNPAQELSRSGCQKRHRRRGEDTLPVPVAGKVALSATPPKQGWPEKSLEVAEDTN